MSIVLCSQGCGLDLHCLYKKGRRMERGTECICVWVCASNHGLCRGFLHCLVALVHQLVN